MDRSYRLPVNSYAGFGRLNFIKQFGVGSVNRSEFTGYCQSCFAHNIIFFFLLCTSISYPLFSRVFYFIFSSFSWAGPPASEVDSLWSVTVQTVFHNEWRVSAFLVSVRHLVHMLLGQTMSQCDSKSYEALLGVGQGWVQFIPAIIWREWDNVSWLHSSVGRASHRYRGSHGFESRWSLRTFSGLSLQLLKWLYNCEDHFHLYSLSAAVHIYDLDELWETKVRWNPARATKKEERTTIFICFIFLYISFLLYFHSWSYGVVLYEIFTIGKVKQLL